MPESGKTRRRTPGALALVVLVLSVACLAPPLGRRIDVGGYRLHIHTAGQGSPTVVFESGVGDPLQVWSWVWPQVARFTQVSVYDRAGLGRSDVGPAPRTSRRIAEELHRLLDRAGVGGPYLLVGHSFGGLNSLMFASLYPDEVVGLVLIDPTPFEYADRERTLLSPEDRRRLETTLALAPLAAKHELDALGESVEQIRAAAALPSVPVLVISAARAGESAESQREWLELQRKLAGELAGARHVIAETSGHYVQFDQPELVVELIRERVEAARR